MDQGFPELSRRLFPIAAAVVTSYGLGVTHDERRRAVTKALTAGTVPRDKPAKIWAGNGTEKPCAICGVTMRASDIEYEIEFASGTSVMLDRECHALWDEHRIRPVPVA